MSRCFPYPTPGYSAKRDSNEALIESIKLQRGNEKAKPERKKESKKPERKKESKKAERKKESKREKKVKKREKEANAKLKVNKLGRREKRKLNDEKTQKWSKETVDLKGRYIQKSGEDEAEQLERSGLTEEHGQPVCSQNICYSSDSDSTQNSNKRKRQALPVNGIRAHGNILRIRLPSQQHKESDVVVSKGKLSSTPGRTDSTGQHNFEIGHGRSQLELCSTSMGTDVCKQGLTRGPDKEQGCSTSGGTGIFAQDNVRTVSVAAPFENEIRMVETLYKDLFESWIPPSLESEQTDLDEQEWLFQRKHHQERERSNASSNASCTGSSTLWPRAQYLPEVDMYALPFTVPF